MEEKEISLYDFWAVIKKNLKFIISLFVVVVVATMLISLFLIPKTYKATSSILPPSVPSKFSGLEGLGKMAGLDLSQGATSTDIFVAILKSRTIADEIIDKFNLMEVYKSKTREEARNTLVNNTEIEVTKEKIIKVSVIDKDPKRAADIANFYLTNLDRLNREINITSAGQMRRFIEKRLMETKEELQKTEDKLKDYQVQNKLLVDKSTQEAAAVAGQLQGRLIAAKVELEAKKKFSTPQNPEIRKLENEVNELEKALVSLPPAETELARLIRDLKCQETIYGLLITQYEQAKIEEAKDTPTVQVLDWATTPERKYKPKVKLNMAISGVLAIFLGIFISFLKESFPKEKITTEENNLS